jgi:hypothetical protein
MSQLYFKKCFFNTLDKAFQIRNQTGQVIQLLLPVSHENV